MSDLPIAMIVVLTRTATRFNIKAQGRAAHLGYLSPPCSNTPNGVSHRSQVWCGTPFGVGGVPVDCEPSVRCATLGNVSPNGCLDSQTFEPNPQLSDTFWAGRVRVLA